MTFVVGNRDRCGRCRARHGGNNHLCDVHGPVSAGCCEPRCNKDEWTFITRYGPVRLDDPNLPAIRERYTGDE